MLDAHESWTANTRGESDWELRAVRAFRLVGIREVSLVGIRGGATGVGHGWGPEVQSAFHNEAASGLHTLTFQGDVGTLSDDEGVGGHEVEALQNADDEVGTRGEQGDTVGGGRAGDPAITEAGVVAMEWVVVARDVPGSRSSGSIFALIEPHSSVGGDHEHEGSEGNHGLHRERSAVHRNSKGQIGKVKHWSTSHIPININRN